MNIKLGEKEYPIEFNVNSLSGVHKETGINPFSEDASSPEFMRALAYHGLKEAARKDKKEFVMTLEDVGELIDFEGMIKLMDLFGSTLPIGDKPGKK